jgi:hypothetical protein
MCKTKAFLKFQSWAPMISKSSISILTSTKAEWENCEISKLCFPRWRAKTTPSIIFWSRRRLLSMRLISHARSRFSRPKHRRLLSCRVSASVKTMRKKLCLSWTNRSPIRLSLIMIKTDQLRPLKTTRRTTWTTLKTNRLRSLIKKTNRQVKLTASKTWPTCSQANQRAIWTLESPTVRGLQLKWLSQKIQITDRVVARDLRRNWPS